MRRSLWRVLVQSADEERKAYRGRMDHYDVIIIGAGINGLVSAAYLAKAGKSVIVLRAVGNSGGDYSSGWQGADGFVFRRRPAASGISPSRSFMIWGCRSTDCEPPSCAARPLCQYLMEFWYVMSIPSIWIDASEKDPLTTLMPMLTM